MNSTDSLDGVLLVDKAPAMTSHDVVAITRRQLGFKKVGHCGTLDPLATGLLLVVIGRGTKIQDLLMSEDKEYVGRMKLGEETHSQDADGVVTVTREVPELTREQIDAAFAKFHGDFYQMPPMVSAIKKDGVALYKLARKGQVVEREPRFVHVFAHEIQEVALPHISFRVACSKGFYVRTYAHDIGNELGCGAHLEQLRRTKSGRFTLDRAVTVDELKTLSREELTSHIISLPEILPAPRGLSILSMRVLRSLAEMAGVPGPVFVAVGVFDGVHRGHQALIRRCIANAAAAQGTPVVVTFDPHPMKVLQPDTAPRLLTSTEHKTALIEALGVSHLLVVPFTPEFAATPPDIFIRQLAASCRPLAEVCVGHAWTFGARRAGNLDLLRQLGKELGYRTEGIADVLHEGEPVSSTRIRRLIAAGDLEGAAQLLGRSYTVLGTVREGDRIGRTIGFPTANLSAHNELFPPSGVHAVRARLGQRQLLGVANIGQRPTVTAGDRPRTLEVHLFDFEEDIYGRDVEIDFAGFLRPERKFGSVEELREQIAHDAVRARALLETSG